MVESPEYTIYQIYMELKTLYPWVREKERYKLHRRVRAGRIPAQIRDIPFSDKKEYILSEETRQMILKEYERINQQRKGN